MAKVHLFAKTYAGLDVPILADEYGNISGGGAAGGSSSAATSDAGGWSYVASTGGITDTADVTLAAAPGNLKANYVTAVQVVNKGGTATEVVVKSGSTVLWRSYAAANGANPIHVVFPRPLVAANNTALTAACVTTGTATLVCAQGFIAALPNIAAQVVSAGEEVVDDFGAYITDDASSIIYNA